MVATRRDPAIDFGAAEDRPAISAVHNAPQPTNTEIHPRLEAGDVCLVWEGALESLAVLAEFRRRRIPVDTPVQDWLYWPEGQWGSHAFDPLRFPDPEGWIRRIHERYHARLMISVWPKFYAGTANFELLRSRGFLYPETLRRQTTDWRGRVHSFYDAFDPAARRLFWQLMDRELFRKGVDAWWMDATEPELVGEGTAAALEASMNPTALGSGARGATARSVYLPRAPGWYDFWSGEWVAGGRSLEAPAPYERLPLYVRAGSILPTGPELQYSDEKPPEPLTLWVYTGADATFELYEDQGTDTGYETGAFATIPLSWNERHRTLTIGRRSGCFPGMLDKRTWRVVFVSPTTPIGHTADPEDPLIVPYDGRELVLRPPS